MQYTNKNGQRFDISVENEHGQAMAFIEGKYIASASTETELEDILDHLSHATTNNTARYLGLQKEETAD